MKDEIPHRGYITSVLGCYCPRCRERKLFQYPVSISIKKNMTMHDQCILCGQPTDIEVGFCYGTGYVSYVIALLLSIISFLAWWILIGFSFQDKRFIYSISLNALLFLVLQPWLMRFPAACGYPALFDTTLTGKQPSLTIWKASILHR